MYCMTPLPSTWIYETPNISYVTNGSPAISSVTSSLSYQIETSHTSSPKLDGRKKSLLPMRLLVELENQGVLDAHPNLGLILMELADEWLSSGGES